MAFAVFFVLFTSCKNSKKQNEKEEKRISKRDLSINASNAYNDLFFDSMVLVKFFAENNTGEELVRRMTSLYNTRNYQFAWFTKNGLTEQAHGFWNMHNYQTTYANDTALNDKHLQKIMDGYAEEQDPFIVSASDRNIINTELKLTQHFIMYILNNVEEGYVKRKEMERFIPVKKEDPLLLADSLLSTKNNDNKDYEDVNNAYKLLKEKLEKYVTVAKKGGWPQITAPARQLKKGRSSPAVVQLKKRLYLTGDMAADTTGIFNAAVEAGIKKFQVRYGYTPTGILTDGLLKDLNVPVLDRIKLLLINMGRMKWMINEPKGQMIVVNIPEFILYVRDGAKKVFDMNVVVGKDGHNTMMFTGNLNQIVFSPYWNLPPSIVKKEIIPAMESNPDYLASQHMEITGNEGGLPVIRQLPGADNSLGKVKFLFPNSFNFVFQESHLQSLY